MENINARDDNSVSGSGTSSSLLDALHSPDVVSNLNVGIRSSSNSRQRQNSTSSDYSGGTGMGTGVGSVVDATHVGGDSSLNSKDHEVDGGGGGVTRANQIIHGGNGTNNSGSNAGIIAPVISLHLQQTPLVQESGLPMHHQGVPLDSSNTNANATGVANTNANTNGDGGNSNTNVTFMAKEQERKQLILYLLAQVCALHDSTPKTFIVHVLSLYESGILDDESINLLMSHGLVPVPNGGNVSMLSPSSIPSDSGENLNANTNLKNPRSLPTSPNGNQIGLLDRGYYGEYIHEVEQIEYDPSSSKSKSTLTLASTAIQTEIEEQGLDRIPKDENSRSSSSNSSSSSDDDSDDEIQEVVITSAITTKQKRTSKFFQGDSDSDSLSDSESDSTGEIQEVVTNAIVAKQMQTTTRHNLHHHVQPQQMQMHMEMELQSRSEKVYAIRKLLEMHENETMNQQWTTTANGGISPPTFFTNNASSWTVEHHPLSFSRYNRDFVQKKLLASGSFGQVFHAMNKLDGCDYAVKRVAFSARGYDTEQVEVVVREVQCLAKMGHENVVRYYTSWLEPTWTPGVNGGEDVEEMDGDSYGKDESSVGGGNQLLLGGPGSDLDESGWSVENSTGNHGTNCNDLDEWDQLESHKSCGLDPHSIGTEGNGMSSESECSEWTVDQSTHRNIPHQNSFQHQNSTKNPSLQRPTQKKNDQGYKYQICLYIQMQLCRPSTLADWIRMRNGADKSLSTQHTRYLAAATIFKQLSNGLSHVHSRNIVHRDLKPANIFHSAEDDCFKIGDFGLSKVLQSANGGIPFWDGAQTSPVNVETIVSWNRSNQLPSHAQEPLTAGVGTTSYAAPEQLESRRYGREADIFSLGLILLELFSDFGSAHERAETFQNCRRAILPDCLTSPLMKDIGDLILSCTKPDPQERPTAQDILKCDLLNNSKVADMQASTIRKLELQLQEKEEENKRLRLVIDEQANQLRDLNLCQPEHSESPKCLSYSDDDTDY